ncbi:MAG: alpha/beta fold hydrolase [Actinomycetota bacterium]|nr:alpha/beta fold hydrolase [Actinomycetota bacterium]
MVRLKAAVAAGAVGGLWALNRRLERGGRAPTGLGGEARRFRWRGGTLAYSVAGEGEPLLLVHGVYAGASSLEFRENFGELSEHFRVYALDLLGCGLSEKPRLRYGPEDVASQVEDFVREEVGGGAHLVASSLTAALVVPAAVRSPKLFKKLVLVCPTGYGTLDRPSGPLGDAVLGLFGAPILGDTLYHALVSRAGIRYYLENMAYHDPALVTDGVVEDYHRAGHGPGSKHFPASFVAGKLNLGVADLWPRVPHKSLLCWGQEAQTVPLSDLGNFARNNPRSEPRVFRDAALLPHVERAATFNKEVRKFLTG